MKTKESLSMTLTERKNVKFTVVGDQIKVKLADIDVLIHDIREKRKKQKLTNIINLVPSDIRRYHDPSFKPTFVKDPINGVVYGIAVGFHPDGNIKWQKISIGESMTLDLDQENDAKIWAVLRMHPCCDVSPLATEARYIVIDPEMEANIYLAKATLIKSVLHTCSTMKKTDVKSFARWCDIPLDGSETINMIRSKLVQLAIDRPEHFEERFVNKSRNFGQVFKSAKQLGLISHDPSKGYKYHDVWLGLTEFECINTLGEANDLFTGMSREVENLDKMTEKKVHGFDKESDLDDDIEDPLTDLDDE